MLQSCKEPGRQFLNSSDLQLRTEEERSGQAEEQCYCQTERVFAPKAVIKSAHRER